MRRENQELNGDEWRKAAGRQEENYEAAAQYAFKNYFSWKEADKWPDTYGDLPYSTYWQATTEEKAAIRERLGIVEPVLLEKSELAKTMTMDQLDTSEAAIKEWELVQEAYRDAFKFEYFFRENLREDLCWQEEIRFLDEVDFVRDNYDELYPDHVYHESQEETGGELNFISLIEHRLGYYERPVRFDQLQPQVLVDKLNAWQKSIEKLKARNEPESEREEEPGDGARVGEQSGDYREIESGSVLRQLLDLQNKMTGKFSPTILASYDRLLKSVSEEIKTRGWRMEKFSDFEDYQDFQKHTGKYRQSSEASKETSFERIVFGDEKVEPRGAKQESRERRDMETEGLIAHWRRGFETMRDERGWNHSAWDRAGDAGAWDRAGDAGAWDRAGDAGSRNRIGDEGAWDRAGDAGAWDEWEKDRNDSDERTR